MITITVKNKSKIAVRKKSPKELYGLPYGEIYIMLGSAEPNPSYFVCTGMNSDPLLLWWDEEDEQYVISPAELDGYNAHIYVEKIDAEISIEMKIS
jgi:hypothetical protein